MELKLTKSKGIKKRSLSYQTLTAFLFFFLMMGYISDFANPFKVAKAPVTVIIPPIGEKAYSIAGEEFVSLWEKITGQKLTIEVFDPAKPNLPSGDLVFIGSDAVSPVVHDLIRSGALETLNIEYGSDDYRMLTLQQQGRRILILAGGSGRSTIYAVYDFFKHQAGVGYFWDGDVITHQDSIALNGIDVLERPHFEYRGLRYFAHRGLHRFQAEHWDLDDWKREIDWVMKKRFNVFMLRTGIDDLFQRAFPDDVPYPPTDAPDPDAKPRSYEDRTSFWPLKYRGELRKQVLQYGRDRGLLNPVDVGTITHWYSATPLSFYKNRPDFPVMKDQKTGYSLPQEAIWDIESQKAWDAYWHLTATDIHEFEGGSARLFHTIGMAERTFGKTARENLQSKLYVYRKTEQMMQQYYPDAPLLVASWDFVLWWKNEDVRNLLKEFNPQKTIILDYITDVTDRVSYKEWGFYKRFPWIAGAFHSFDRNSDIHEDYNILSRRLKEASEDSMCRGLVAWSEISHDDTYFLEYIADNSWNPNHLNKEDFIQNFCQRRYPQAFITKMQEVWSSFLPISQCANWCSKATTPGYLLFAEPQFRVLTSNQLINLTPDLANKWTSEYERLTAGLKESQVALKRLADLTVKLYSDPFWRGDALDIARTIASRALFASMARGVSQMEEWQQRSTKPEEVLKYAQLSQDLIASLADILSMSDDFSMYASLLKLSDAKEIDGIEPTLNPHTELTLKANAENNYCRSQQYELVQYVYRLEYKAFWKWVLNRVSKGDRTAWNRPSEFDTQEKSIVNKFYKTPLKEMAPTKLRNAKEMSQSLLHLEKLIENLNLSQ